MFFGNADPVVGYRDPGVLPGDLGSDAENASCFGVVQ